MRFRKIRRGQLMVIGRTVWGPKVPTLKGTEASLFYVLCFLYLVCSSINVSIFLITCMDTFWTDLVHTSRLMQKFLVKYQIAEVIQPPYIPDLVPWDFWLFPKLKSPLKGKRFQTISEIQENAMGSWWRLGELCEAPRCLLWRRLRHHCPMYSGSSILYLLQ